MASTKTLHEGQAMTRPRYLPTPAIEILRREIPGLPWRLPDGIDATGAQGWAASVSTAEATLASGAVLTATRNNAVWSMSLPTNDRFASGYGKTPTRAFDDWAQDNTTSGRLTVPSWPAFEVWMFGGMATAIVLALSVLALVDPGEQIRPVARIVLLCAGLLTALTVPALVISRAQSIRRHRKQRRALAIAEVMRRPLPWLVAAKGPQADAGSLSLTP